MLQDRNSFTLKLEDTENWLYEDGEDQPKQVYIDKLTELKVCGEEFGNVDVSCQILQHCCDSERFLDTCFTLFQTLGQPIQARFQESEERPKAFEDLGKQIQQYMKTVHAFKAKVFPCLISGKYKEIIQ